MRRPRRRASRREHAITRANMLLLILLLITSAGSHRVTESLEDLPPDAFNTTTLFPVNRTVGATGTDRNDVTDKPEDLKVKNEATVWKLETSFGESKLDEKESEQGEKEVSTTPAPTPTPKQDKTKNASTEFRPSPHLGSFIEGDDYSLEIIPTKATLGEFRPLKRPPSGFVGISKDNFKSSFYQSPKDPFKHNQFPYKIESIGTRGKNPLSWRPDTLDSKPTMESPMRVPAGSFYKAPNSFKEKPTLDDEDFGGLSFDDLKENNNLDIKKRVNPWKSLLRLVTAFIPVGLIISALTPSIVTVHSTGPGPDNGYPPPHLYRRSDNAISQLAPISEPCRRRLLCELHSDTNYAQNLQTPRRRKQCFRIRCEEPEALAKMLQWLLSHRAGDQRGQDFT